MMPLTRSGHIAHRTSPIKGKPAKSMAAEAAAFIKPNSRLTSLERLDIYSRSYWFRLMGSIREDFPGLQAAVGSTAFERLSQAYLVECPSQSFTLRNLGFRLQAWLRRNPSYAGTALGLALDMVGLERAHIEAFDGAAYKALGSENLIYLAEGSSLGVQPHLQLLALKFPVDELRIQVNRASSDDDPESTSVPQPTRRLMRRAARLRPMPIFVAVHRFDSNVYYRRIAFEEYSLLNALRQGQSIGEAVGSVFASSPEPLDRQCSLLSSWFAAWAELGWLCQRQEEIK
jgi:Putative DNA-binding domain